MLKTLLKEQGSSRAKSSLDGFHRPDEVLQTLIEAIDTKDNYTGIHCRNVAHISVQIADAFGCSPDIREHIRQAALIHDIGKIGINNQILQKNSALDPDEFDEIRRHPEMGACFVKHLPFSRETEEVILYHHEWYDGNGYPGHLQYDNIPLYVRIVSVADAVDSMLRDRPYRKALSMQKIEQELISYSGTQFDPSIVELLLDSAIPLLQHAAS